MRSKLAPFSVPSNALVSHPAPSAFPARLSGQRILVIESVDATRATLSGFLAKLKQRAAAAAATSGGQWEEPVLGVFVLFSKAGPKQELPQEVLVPGRYFIAETAAANVTLSMPFHVDGLRA